MPLAHRSRIVRRPEAASGDQFRFAGRQPAGTGGENAVRPGPDKTDARAH